MADVRWIKLSTDIFANRKIRQIESLPEGDGIIVIWLKLLCLAGIVNDNGQVYFTKELPYTDQMLATEFNRPLSTVQLALATFRKFGMIEIIDDVYHLSNWEKYQNVDRLTEIREYNRLAQQKSRAKKKALASVNDMSMTSQRCHETEEEREEEKEIEREYSSSPSFAREDFSDKDERRLEVLGGELGKGFVRLSQEQTDGLLDLLSVDEFDHYVGVIARCEMAGKHYAKGHYQAILDMVEKDRMVAARRVEACDAER